MRFSILLLAASLHAQNSLQFLNLGTAGQACCVAADNSGKVYAASTQTVPGSVGAVQVSKFDSNNNLVYRYTFPAPGGQPTAIAVDS